MYLRRPALGKPEAGRFFILITANKESNQDSLMMIHGESPAINPYFY